MDKQVSKFTLRIPTELLDVLRKVAEENGRSVNKEIEMLIKNHITECKTLD